MVLLHTQISFLVHGDKWKKGDTGAENSDIWRWWVSMRVNNMVRLFCVIWFLHQRFAHLYCSGASAWLWLHLSRLSGFGVRGVRSAQCHSSFTKCLQRHVDTETTPNVLADHKFSIDDSSSTTRSTSRGCTFLWQESHKNKQKTISFFFLVI